MIHTLTTSLALYKVHKNKLALLIRAEQRKAICYLSGITFCVTATAFIWIFWIRP